MQQFIGIRQDRNCSERSRTEEHEISMKKNGFDTSMKEVTRRGSSFVRIPKIPWLIFEQFKDTLVEFQLHMNWWGQVQNPYDWKGSVFHRGCSLNIKSILENGLNAGGKQSKEGRQTIFFTPLNPFRRKSRWTSAQWWFHNSQESALSQQLET